MYNKDGQLLTKFQVSYRLWKQAFEILVYIIYKNLKVLKNFSLFSLQQLKYLFYKACYKLMMYETKEKNIYIK